MLGLERSRLCTVSTVSCFVMNCSPARVGSDSTPLRPPVIVRGLCGKEPQKLRLSPRADSGETLRLLELVVASRSESHPRLGLKTTAFVGTVFYLSTREPSSSRPIRSSAQPARSRTQSHAVHIRPSAEPRKQRAIRPYESSHSPTMIYVDVVALGDTYI